TPTNSSIVTESRTAATEACSANTVSSRPAINENSRGANWRAAGSRSEFKVYPAAQLLERNSRERTTPYRWRYQSTNVHRLSRAYLVAAARSMLLASSK